MRRFVWTMATLSLVGCAVFLIGWLPLRIRPGSYAVLVTKTGGVDPRVIAPGGFRWSASTFLPTNARLVAFHPTMAERRIEVVGELPSAKAYAEFMAGSPDFSYALSARLAAAPKPEALPVLFSRWGVDDDEKLAAWLDSELDLAASDLRAALLSSTDGAGVVDEASLALSVSSKHPLLDVRSAQVVSSRAPDRLLYDQAKEFYASYLARFRDSVEPALAEASSRAAADQVRIDALKRYGELLERYPALVDYLAIQAGIAPRPTGGK